MSFHFSEVLAILAGFCISVLWESIYTVFIYFSFIYFSVKLVLGFLCHAVSERMSFVGFYIALRGSSFQL